MEEVALKDLDNRLQKQVENARKAVDKNPSYAVDILQNICARNPGCLEIRKILRQAQHRARGASNSPIVKAMRKVIALPVSLMADSKVKKDPEKAMVEAEKILSKDPACVPAYKMLGSASEALELHETSAFAYEEARKIEPDNTEIVRLLMNAYINTGRDDEAIRIGEEAYRKNPADDKIEALIKKASVEQSIEKGKWDEEASFREKLKDEDEAQKLEQSGRAKIGESNLRNLIEDAKKQVKQEPENINHYRDISSNYRKLGEYDNAIEWLEKARQLESGSADVNLERLVGTLKREKMDKEIEEKKAALEEDPENEELQKELDRLRTEERTFRLNETEKLVQRYPNEFSYRYELGELYLEEGETDKAIKELQLAQRSPKVRINALILIGKAYKSKGFHDLAAEQLEIAKSEISGVTDQKKDVLYELGDCYEQQGEMEKAMAEFKALYGADIAYRDVAEKIEAFYARKNEEKSG